jgi:LmbE family N-acetylglucosaminyl deacetylase
MKKAVVAVFAHPDDEAFGPGGTLAKLSKTSDVYLITVTGGERGKNSLKKSEKKLSDIRHKELLEATKILGVKKVFFLGYEDGTLSNSIYHEIASKIEKKLKELKPATVITFEPRGVSGHIDHIAVSLITTFVVKKLPYVKDLLYHCIREAQSKQMNDYFIYFPKGYKKSEIDKIVDIKEVWEIKKRAMLEHKSQKHDAIRILKQMEKLPKEEYFIRFKKN